VDELADESSIIIELNGINSLLELIIDDEDDEDKFMFAAELVWPVVIEALAVGAAAAAVELAVAPVAFRKDSVEFESSGKC